MEYRALDLYKISSRKGKRKSFHLNLNKGAKIQAFVTDDKNLKKLALKDSLVGADITEDVLKNNYVVYLLDNKNNIILKKTGKTKDVLEEFNKKLGNSKYKIYLSELSDLSNIDSVENLMEEDAITIDSLRESPRESKKYLSTVNAMDTKRIIQEEDLISTSIRSINLELDKDLSDDKIVSIINLLDGLRIPMAQNTLVKAIEKLDVPA